MKRTINRKLELTGPELKKAVWLFLKTVAVQPVPENPQDLYFPTDGQVFWPDGIEVNWSTSDVFEPEQTK